MERVGDILERMINENYYKWEIKKYMNKEPKNPLYCLECKAVNISGKLCVYCGKQLHANDDQMRYDETNAGATTNQAKKPTQIHVQDAGERT